MKTKNKLNHFLERFEKVNEKRKGNFEILNIEDFDNLSGNELRFKHDVCQTITTTKPKYFLESKMGCHRCAQLKRNQSNVDKNIDHEIEKIKNYNFSIIEFKGKSLKNKLKCNNCNYEFHVTLKRFFNRKGMCPNCSIEKVNKISNKIRKYQIRLNEKHIPLEIIPEYFHGVLKPSKFMCKNCKSPVIEYFNNLDQKNKTNFTANCECEYRKKGTQGSRLESKYKIKLKYIENGDYEIVKGSFKNSVDYCKFKHKTCGHIFEKKPIDFFYNFQKCPKCTKNNKLFKNNKDLFELLNNLNIELLEPIDNTTNFAQKELDVTKPFKCKKCDERFNTSIRKIKNGYRCKYCDSLMSLGEKRIKRFLERNGIKFEKEKTFVDLVGLGKGLLRFDFYLNDLNMVIEYDGEQHFKPNFFKSLCKEDYMMKFQNLILHDRIKDEYCKNKNIKIKRISYLDFKNIEQILTNEILL